MLSRLFSILIFSNFFACTAFGQGLFTPPAFFDEIRVNDLQQQMLDLTAHTSIQCKNIQGKTHCGQFIYNEQCDSLVKGWRGLCFLPDGPYSVVTTENAGDTVLKVNYMKGVMNGPIYYRPAQNATISYQGAAEGSYLHLTKYQKGHIVSQWYLNTASKKGLYILYDSSKTTEIYSSLGGEVINVFDSSGTYSHLETGSLTSSYNIKEARQFIPSNRSSVYYGPKLGSDLDCQVWWTNIAGIAANYNSDDSMGAVHFIFEPWKQLASQGSDQLQHRAFIYNTLINNRSLYHRLTDSLLINQYLREQYDFWAKPFSDRFYSLDGKYEWYYQENNSLKPRVLTKTFEAVDDLVDGPYLEWHRNGKRKLKGAYTAGYRSGTWRWYDEYGKLVRKKRYDNTD